jgi:hypothetical protein
MLTCGISDLWAFTSVAIAIAKDAEVIALITAQRDLLDDRSRYCAQEQQHEGYEEYDRQRRRGAQHSVWYWPGSNECGVAGVVVGRATAWRGAGERRWVHQDGESDQVDERRRSSMRKNVL